MDAATTLITGVHKIMSIYSALNDNKKVKETSLQHEQQQQQQQQKAIAATSKQRGEDFEEFSVPPESDSSDMKSTACLVTTIMLQIVFVFNLFVTAIIALFPSKILQLIIIWLLFVGAFYYLLKLHWFLLNKLTPEEKSRVIDKHKLVFSLDDKADENNKDDKDDDDDVNKDDEKKKNNENEKYEKYEKYEKSEKSEFKVEKPLTKNSKRKNRRQSSVRNKIKTQPIKRNDNNENLN